MDDLSTSQSDNVACLICAPSQRRVPRVAALCVPGTTAAAKATALRSGCGRTHRCGRKHGCLGPSVSEIAYAVVCNENTSASVIKLANSTSVEDKLVHAFVGVCGRIASDGDLMCFWNDNAAVSHSNSTATRGFRVGCQSKCPRIHPTLTLVGWLVGRTSPHQATCVNLSCSSRTDTPPDE
jgi:hypothetical protein